MPRKKNASSLARGAALVASLPILENTGGKYVDTGRVLERGKLTEREWRFVILDAQPTRLRPLLGVEPGECRAEHVFGDGERIDMGGCGAKESRVCVNFSRRGPEVVVIRYRCAACGQVDDDVAD